MFSKVLVPIDFSEEGDRVLKFVKGLIPLGLGEVILTHCIDTARAVLWPLPEKMQAAIADKLEERKSLMGADGINARTLLTEGNPAQEVLRAAESLGVSLVVTGSHGKKLLEELLLGSVSEALGRAAKAPVLMVRYDLLRDIEMDQPLDEYARGIFKRILCPSDFSGASNDAVRLASKLRKLGAEEATVLHIVNPKQVETEAEKDELIQVCSEEVEQASKKMTKAGLPTVGVCRVGDPLREILAVSDEVDATILVMGSHGKSIVKEWLVGSVSLNAVRVADRPALLVHE